MHVTVVGAGALGRIYGLRLAAAGNEVAFAVRPARLAETDAFVAEQVNGTHRRDTLEHPQRVGSIPPRTRAVLVTVRFDQMSSPDLVDLLRKGPPAPVVTLTPILPAQHAALEAALGRTILPAMPNASGYLDERGVVRYWVIKVASTLLEHPASIEAHAAVEELAQQLTRAGIPSHLERGVSSFDAATTVAFFPLIAAIDVGGGIEGVLGDKDLVALALDAARECDALAKKLGRVAPWAHLLTRFAGPYTLKPGVALARRLVPESVRFVEAHFGPKLHAQHLAMGEAILALGEAEGLPMEALAGLMERSRGR